MLKNMHLLPHRPQGFAAGLMIHSSWEQILFRPRTGGREKPSRLSGESLEGFAEKP